MPKKKSLSASELQEINMLPGLKAIFKEGVSMRQIIAVAPMFAEPGEMCYYVRLVDDDGYSTDDDDDYLLWAMTGGHKNPLNSIVPPCLHKGYHVASRDSNHGFFLRLNAGLITVKIPDANDPLRQLNF